MGAGGWANNNLYVQGGVADHARLVRRRGEDILVGVVEFAGPAAPVGQEDDAVYAFVHEALDFFTREDPTVDELVPAEPGAEAEAEAEGDDGTEGEAA